MKILVTGGSGFVGAHLVARLKSLGHEVIAPTRRWFDLLDPKQAKHWLDFDNEIVIHLAATVGGIGFNQKNPIRCLNENLMMSTNVFQAMESNPPKKFIALGSVCAYPKFTPTPFKEEDLWNGYPEETNAPYGLAKRMLLTQCQAYRQAGLNAVYLLPANMYGPEDHFDLEDSHVIPALIRKCVEAKESGQSVKLWGSGKATRDFLYVEDCVEAIIRAITSYDSGEPVNIGTGVETSIYEIACMIAEIVGLPTSRFVFESERPDGQPRRVLDVTKAKEFGFEVETSLVDGLKKTVEWYYSNKLERAA